MINSSCCWLELWKEIVARFPSILEPTQQEETNSTQYHKVGLQLQIGPISWHNSRLMTVIHQCHRWLEEFRTTSKGSSVQQHWRNFASWGQIVEKTLTIHDDSSVIWLLFQCWTRSSSLEKLASVVFRPWAAEVGCIKQSRLWKFEKKQQQPSYEYGKWRGHFLVVHVSSEYKY